MNTDFPLETRALVEKVLCIGRADNELIDEHFRSYFTDATLLQIRSDVSQRFSNIETCERQLGHAFAQLKTICPDFVVPRVYTQLTALGQSIVIGDSLIGIGLDKYLGADYPAYKRFFTANQRASMEPSRMVQDCLTFYLTYLYPNQTQTEGKRPMLYETILHEGKIYWIVAKLLQKNLVDVAACHPATKLWYRTHCAEAWRTLCKNPATLRDTTYAIMNSVVMTATPAPYFKSKHSRGVGIYIGMLFINDFMKANPGMTYHDLLHFHDYKKVLRDNYAVKSKKK